MRRFPMCIGPIAVAASAMAPASTGAAEARSATLPAIEASDIGRFWQAYDAVRKTADPDEQVRQFIRLYVLPGSPGLQAFMEAKGYTPLGYVMAIRRYPKFWDSVRQRSGRLGAGLDGLAPALTSLRRVYPALKPATITFAMGALRSGGTTLDDKVLMGAELAAGDATTDLTEFDEARRRALSRSFAGHSPAKLTLTIVHEVVHTQQHGDRHSLLAQAIYEGVADFVAEKATGRLPQLDYVTYGPAHSAAIRTAFVRDMTKDDYGFWFYTDANNPFSTRDLGYYVGYAIASSYYAKSPDKAQAIREMIELDYSDDAAVGRFADRSGWLTETS